MCTGAMTTASLSALLNAGVADSVFPGATMAWQAGDDAPLHQIAVGRHTYATDAPAVTEGTIYDLASLTKIVTATAAIRLMSAHDIHSDDEVRRFLPRSQAQGVTIAHLLTHTSALDIRLSAVAHHGVDELWRRVYALTPQAQPGTNVAYANVNTLLLGEIVARVTGYSLAEALHALVLHPAGMTMTRFNPPPDWRPHIPPAEQDAIRGVVHGEVHDESCASLGGVAGHAGLFGTAVDMVRFGRGWLDTLAGASPWQIAVTDAQQALRNHSREGQLGCGWGWMLQRRNFMGAAWRDMAAHTGFTGPVVAIMPRLGVAWALMSNRTWPTRSTPPQHHGVTAQISEYLWYPHAH
jgi:CubicO group peptidase (beta-lactamase class C family)